MHAVIDLQHWQNVWVLWQVACYGCLDVLTKVVFGYVLMSSYSIIERVESAEVAECAAMQALALL